MYKIGKILIRLVGYFSDQKFYRGKGLLYEENRLFLGPCIDNLHKCRIGCRYTGWRDSILEGLDGV